MGDGLVTLLRNPAEDGVPDNDRHHVALARMATGIVEAVGSEDLARRICQVVYDNTDCVRVSLGQVERSRGRFRVAYWPPLARDRERRLLGVFALHALQHPRLRSFVRGRPIKGAASWWQIDPSGRFEGTQLYRRFYAADGITDQISIALPAPRRLAIGITVDRAGGRFSADEVALFNQLQRCLEAVFSRVGVSSVGPALELLGWDRIEIDSAGTVVGATATVQRFESSLGSLEPGSVLVDRAWWPRLAEALSASRFLATESASLTPLRAGEAQMVAEVPLVGHAILHLGPAPTPVAVQAVHRLLTQRQLEVAQGLMRGATNAEIAEQLGVAPATVRRHLEQIYGRLGVGSRTAAVAVLLGAQAPAAN